MIRCTCTASRECVACLSAGEVGEARRDRETDGHDDSKVADRYERGFGW